jgi:hypothetical protein
MGVSTGQMIDIGYWSRSNRLRLRNSPNDGFSPTNSVNLNENYLIKVEYTGPSENKALGFSNNVEILDVDGNVFNYALTNDFGIGWANFNGREISNALISEILIYDKQLSEKETAEVNFYLAEKWDLKTSIDSDGDGLMDADDSEPTVSNNLMGEGSGLMAYYSFDGNSNDSSGNGLNGSRIGATLTSDRFGNSNKAYNFDGNDYIEISDDPKLTSIDKLSIVAWFKKTSNSNFLTIIQKGNDDKYEEYVLSVKNSSIYFDVGGSSGPYIQPSVSVSSGVWHHIVAVHNRTGGNSSLKIFLNGQNIGGTVVHPELNPGDNSYSVKIGKRTDYSEQSFIGQIDEVRFYNRALSDEDISILYNSY